MKIVARTILLTLVLLAISISTWAAPTADESAYTINVHVSASYMVHEGNDSPYHQHLSVVIDGKKYELRAGSINARLALGDYKAKLVRDSHPTSYDSFQVYEFLFRDNKTRKFDVVGELE
jgi:hypothetical protein